MPHLSIVSFNTHGGVRPLRRRRATGLFPLAEVLANFDADVLVLQEVWRPDDQVAVVDEAAALRGEHVYEVSFGRGTALPWPHLTPRRGGNGSFSIAVSTRLPVRPSGEIRLANVPVDPLDDRRALHLELDVDGVTIDLVAVHLTSRLPHGPPVQLRSLNRGLPPPGRPAVVAGDCNFWGPGVNAFLPGFTRAVRGRTWPAHLPHSQIDHVLVRGGITVVEHSVLPDVGSDHRPVRAVLEIPA